MQLDEIHVKPDIKSTKVTQELNRMLPKDPCYDTTVRLREKKVKIVVPGVLPKNPF